MDSKSRMPSAKYEEEAPPAYSDSSYSTYPTSSSSTSQNYYSSQIQSQLSNLTTQISSIQTQRDALSHAQDEKILSLLTNDIQIYLSDLAKTGLRKGTLVLIPANAVEDEKALPADFDFAESDEFARVVRVKDKEGDDSRKSPRWFWRDEDMANRLASYLQPKPDPRTLELPARKEEIMPKPEASTSRGFWGRKKSTTVVPERKQEPKPEMSGVKDGEDKVSMDVNAEEMVFRTENDLGIWETERGYGIVVKLRVVLAKRY
jgi:hypothetical protein